MIWYNKLSGEDTWAVGVEGRLDQDQVPQLEDTLNDLLEKGHNHILINLSRTTYINSAGLRCLVSVWRRCRSSDGSLTLCGLNPRLHEIFTMVGFDKVFTIHPECTESNPESRPRKTT